MEALESRRLLTTILPAPVSAVESYEFELLAKAQPDEWFTGYEDADGNYVSGPYYALGQQPAGVEGRPKVNHDYLWGLTESNGLIWFGTSGNVLCLAGSGLVGAGTDGILDSIHVTEGAASQYPLPARAEDYRAYLGDWRPPKIHVYNPTTDIYRDITPNDSLLGTTLGLRSAGSYDNLVLFAGPDITFLGMNVFAFNARTQEYLGSRQILQYCDVRNWVRAGNQLYAGVLKTFSETGEGAVLQWTGTVSNPFSYREVATLDLNASNMVLHDNRLYVGTWPLSMQSLMGALGYQSTALPGIWMSPQLDASGNVSSGSWQKVWDIMEYEPDPAIAQSVGLGAMESFDGYLYFGTMQVPGTGTQALLDAYPDYSGNARNTTRSIAIFRCDDFDSATPHVQLLFGDSMLYQFTPPPVMSVGGNWTRVPNNSGQALFGAGGMDNSRNCYTWSMEVYDGRLYVGTLDGTTTGALGDAYIAAGGDAAAIEAERPETWMGADLWCFFPDAENGDPVRPIPASKTGIGNPLNHGVRNMVATPTGLYLGTANASNLLTAEDNATRYPDKPGLQAGGWELRRLETPASAASIAFTYTGAASVAEGITSNTVLGTFAVDSPEPGHTYTFALVDNAAGRFYLDGDQLMARRPSTGGGGFGPPSNAARLDFELLDSHDLVVRVTDDTGAWSNQVVHIGVTDSPEPPVYSQLSGIWVTEGAAAGTVIGTVTGLEQDAGDTIVSFSLTNTLGGAYALDPATNQLKVANGSLIDFETSAYPRITIRATDSTGLSRDTSIVLYVLNVNEAPTGLLLSDAFVFEGSRTGTVVGTLTAIDADAGESFTYTLTDSAGGRFQIVGGQLQVANGGLLDRDVNATHNVTVRVTDSGSLSFTRTFTIDVYALDSLPVPAGVTASDGVYTDKVVVSWNAVPGMTGYVVYRNTIDNSATAEFSFATAATSVDDTYTQFGTTYYYWVKSYKVANDAYYYSAFSLGDSGQRDSTLPVPSGVTASDGTFADKVLVSWNAVPGAMGYVVYRSTTNDSATGQFSFATTTTSIDDTYTRPGTTYYYWVKSYKVADAYFYSDFSEGDSGYWNAAMQAPVGLNASDGTFADKVLVSWSAVPGVTGYVVYRSTTNDSATSQFSFSTTTTSIEDTYARPGTTYYYWVKSYKVAAGYHYSDFSAGDSGYRLAAPTGVTASDGAYADKVVVNWNAAPGVTGYVVYRNTTNDSATSQFSFSTTTTSIEDTYTNAGRTYYYWVKSYKVSAGYHYSDFSAGDSGFLSYALPVPAGVTASDGAYSDKVVVSWSLASGVTGYAVYRNTVDDWTTSKFSFATTGTSIEDTYAASGTTYYYWVRSYIAGSPFLYSDFGASDSGFRSASPAPPVFGWLAQGASAEDETEELEAAPDPTQVARLQDAALQDWS